MVIYEFRKNSIDVFEMHSNNFPLHLHTHIEILICTSGEMQVSCCGVEKNLHKDDIMIIFPNEIHSYKKTETGRGIMIIFDPNISDVIMTELNKGIYSNFVHCDKVIEFAKQLLACYQENGSYTTIYGYLHVIFGLTLKKVNTSKSTLSLKTFDIALKYISENYTKPLTLESVSKVAGVSRSHLSRVFSERIDGGFKHYLTMLRIEKAKNMLQFTDRNISDIMYESGFTDQRTFNRSFKNIINMTPSQYRLIFKFNC